ncbi:MAG: hypothetical protein A2W61_05215 [Deltaproteobacteria bacterium RIFCSPLOWO2_01_44_7]|nr:MAG: hypothetical protein A2712_01715 [Deltaproteobacteria bacterium RIFCSPHIGHO2_01_FULL_43_49]OGQ15155.1 MAG: hypothetical protein A3D22_03760 [Deltaproteobacteria bacterium RIFCSPHIGHO2_02_FULL_44_53]OGQ27224.1 MAG: hypothetical protein A3D98_02310 [Deltaproteobacteria bacterium RIFCSPHIGHO2_12_FULL_44_21]OGQ31672.1 MAG: hypothetical protein A2979_04920 [Deltaproteobacteria bacterium RIFCSPLOWO2_01_FULL_45_74]OGQ38812.1 MAG: hypothetical protein A2W61_05215 [Deltaproteobacteria bacterium 
MAGSLNVTNVVRKTDLLDGKQDRTYHGLSLLNGDSTPSVCKFKEDAEKQFKTKMVETYFKTRWNAFIPVNCNGLLEKLDRLANIINKMPINRLYARFWVEKLGQPQGEFRKGEVYAFQIVDHMILSLLLGVGLSTQTFPELFDRIAFDEYPQYVRFMGRLINRPEIVNPDIKSREGAFRIFEEQGRKYGFDTAAFKGEQPQKNPPEKPAILPVSCAPGTQCI